MIYCCSSIYLILYSTIYYPIIYIFLHISTNKCANGWWLEEAKEDFQDFHDGILQIFSRFDLSRGPNLTYMYSTFSHKTGTQEYIILIPNIPKKSKTSINTTKIYACVTV